MSDKRRAEFLAGRLCADHCLKRFGHINFIIDRHTDRSPIWPKNVTGSITHSRGRAACIVGKKKDYAGVGIDTAYAVDDNTAHRVAKHVITPQEIDLFDTHHQKQLNFGQYYTLAFSAKESICKALYSEIRSPFFFHNIEIEGIRLETKNYNNIESKDLEDNHQFTGRLFCRAKPELTSSVKFNSPLEVSFIYADGFINTWVTLSNSVLDR